MRIPSLQLLQMILILIEPRTLLHLAIMRERRSGHLGIWMWVIEVDEEVTVELVGYSILFGIYSHHVARHVLWNVHLLALSLRRDLTTCWLVLISRRTHLQRALSYERVSLVVDA